MAENLPKESQEEKANTEVENNDDLNKANSQNDSNEQDNSNDISNNKENQPDSVIQDYPETQTVDIDHEDNDFLSSASQPNYDQPRGLTGKIKIKRIKRINTIKLDDIPSWDHHAPSILQGKRLPKQEELLYPPNDTINHLISYIPRGDSTILEVDAIVNAANSGLYAGGGICGSIHRAAGPELEEACMKIGGCETGNAVITPGFDLPSKYVIHAVGPVGQNPEKLESAYQKTLEFIDGTKVRSVALCCISTGIYGYPIRPATRIALKTVREFLENEENRKKVDRIIFVVFNPKDCLVYENYLPFYFPLPEGAIKGAEEDDVEEEEEEDVNNGIYINESSETESVTEPEEREMEFKINQIVSKEQKVQPNEKEIELKEKVIESKEKVIESKEKVIESKEKLIESKEQNVSPEEEIQLKEKIIESKENEIESKEKVIESEEKVIEYEANEEK